MDSIRITKHFFFEAAHALYGYDGKCKNIHGHSYNFMVTVIGKPIQDSSNVKNGMLIDFGDLKAIVKKEIVDVFDHTTILNRNSPHKDLGKHLEAHGHKVILTDYQPTSEMMLIDFARRIQPKLPEGVRLHSLRLYETATSFSEWYAEDK